MAVVLAPRVNEFLLGLLLLVTALATTWLRDAIRAVSRARRAKRSSRRTRPPR
jgi:hypothetical protein